MKTLMLLAALCLVLCVVLPQTDGACYLIRYTRCYLVQSNGRWYRICVVQYRYVCVRKRDQIEDDQGRTESKRKGPEKAILEKFPHKCSTYDKNGDGSITFDEFQKTLSDVHDTKTLQKLFKETDENGDGVITCKDEFLQAKFDFSKKPVNQ
ncbi:uncharacterized protein LOC116308758 [Actinia tenebrosa]|uniref:Uncharacterized protein LOC116308758 n=1 Tax=Actinia tenebrosa TaxID=6105 RepID=A0A6P8JFL0_ACTTE|nr:uncharacterized protein LOC116308758 [Actinia tenebrosa]